MWKASPTARVIGLSAVMVAVGTALTVYSLRWGAPHAPFHVAWYWFIPAFMLCDAFVFHLEIRDEAHSFSPTELPLVVGFFFAAPWAVILGRMIGEITFLGLRRRQSPVKLAFNLSMFLPETALALIIFRGLEGVDPPNPLDPAGWGVVLLAILAADLLSGLAVSNAIRWHGGSPRLTQVVMAGGFTAVVNVSLALMAAIVLWVSPWGMLIFGLVAIVSALAYRGYANLTRRYASLQLLYDFTKVVGASMRGEAVMDEVLSEARNLLRASVAEIVLVDRATGRPGLRQVNSDGEESGSTVVEPEDTEVDPVWSEVVNGGQPLVIPRTSREPDHVAFRERLGIRDAIVAPLRSENSVIGTIMVANRLGEVSTFDEPDLRLFATLANHASVAFENGRLVEQLRREAYERQHEALHDPLTSLPNRTLFIQRVGEMTRLAGTEPTAAVMLMDLDRFKEVNDTLGHHNGDLLLREVAARLIAALGPRDTVARLGGDEFAVLLPDLSSAEEADAAAERIISALHRPFVVDELSLEVGASIGIALVPEHGDDATTLLQRADVAMYEAKTSKRGRALYSFERDNYSPRRLALAGELRHAIENGDVLVYHQPKARLADGLIVGTEALVRWRHPVQGFLPPDEFIPVAEHTGLISILTVHVLRSALAQCARWREMGHDLGVAVNLAVRSLLDADLPEVVTDLLRELNVPAGHLTLELTESGIMADPVRTISVLERFAEIGVQLSVDDFGTGYSSLAYLQRLPVNEVKVDQSFVYRMATDPNDAMIVQSIIELGHNLALSVAAEGVENQVSWDRLRAMSCDVAQGYHLSRPAPADEVTRWLDARARALAGATG